MAQWLWTHFSWGLVWFDSVTQASFLSLLHEALVDDAGHAVAPLQGCPGRPRYRDPLEVLRDGTRLAPGRCALHLRLVGSAADPPQKLRDQPTFVRS